MSEEILIHEKLLKATDVAEILSISRAYAYKLMSLGELRSVQIGKAKRVRPRDLNAFVQENLSRTPAFSP